MKLGPLSEWETIDLIIRHPISMNSDRLTIEEKNKAAAYYAKFLETMGVDFEAYADLADTPMRVVKAYEEMWYFEPWEFTTFPLEGPQGLVLEKNIPWASTCRHHILPMVGMAHVAYIPNQRLAGLSKLARVVETAAKGLSVQEEVGQKILEMMTTFLDPKGVAVYLKAEHTCMTLRGVRAHGTETITSHLSGCFMNEPETRAEFFACLNI